jgi:hypothetical protein
MASNYGLDGVEALREAANAVGLVTDEALASTDARADLALVTPGGDRVMVALKRFSLVSAEGLQERIGQWNRRLPGTTVGVVVADRVTHEAREILRAAGWGWLDLRGHLHIVGRGVFVDVDVPALRVASTRSSPLVGRVGIEVAAALLMDPSAQVGIRSLAGLLNRAPSSVSDVLSSMQSAGLVDDQRRPVLPELFWELADRWDPLDADMQAIPSPGRGAVNDALKLGLDDVETTTGWALTDTVAAATYGAPVSVRSDHPRDFYVPDQATLRRAVHLLGAAPDRAGRAATLRVAPVPMICSRRVDATAWAKEEWPLVQPLFVALDLARDPGRGREVLNAWTPTEPWHRVW